MKIEGAGAIFAASSHVLQLSLKAKKRRAQKLAQALRKLGYSVIITPVDVEPVTPIAEDPAWAPA
jgi:hypothetical protein